MTDTARRRKRPRAPVLLKEEPRRRLRLLRRLLAKEGLDGLLVLSEPNVHYLSGFTGQESALLVGKKDRLLITDFRYLGEAEQSLPAAAGEPRWKVVLRKGTLIEEAAVRAQERSWRRLGFEADAITFSQYRELGRAARRREARVNLVPAKGLVERLRKQKSPAEVAAIRGATRTAEKAGYEARKLLRPGITELELARFIERRMEDLGAQSASFPVIAAFGPHAALPHAKPGRTRARARTAALVDWGARSAFYCSDLTRVFPVTSIPAWLREARRAVLEAREAALSLVRPGRRAREIDAAAREVLAGYGWEKNFGHGLGHGVGLEVHEAPGIAPRSREVLAPGMVFTIEPGLYFKGRGGVRIEDMVAVTKDGFEVLSQFPREGG